MDKDTTPSEPRLDEDLSVEDESAEQVTGGHSMQTFNPKTANPKHFAPGKTFNR